MKIKIQLAALVIALLVAVSGLTATAQTKNFKDGSVWDVTFIKTKANMSVEYLNSLKSTWKALYDQAIKDGMVLSYKILEGTAANPDDWDIMLMIEYKNMASMEGNDDKWDSMMKTVLGGEQKMKATNEGRVNIRELYGSKMLREVVYK